MNNLFKEGKQLSDKALEDIYETFFQQSPIGAAQLLIGTHKPPVGIYKCLVGTQEFPVGIHKPPVGIEEW